MAIEVIPVTGKDLITGTFMSRWQCDRTRPGEKAEIKACVALAKKHQVKIDPFANVVIASEAKQSQYWQPAEIKADCFVTSFLAKTLNRLFARASKFMRFKSTEEIMVSFR